MKISIEQALSVYNKYKNQGLELNYLNDIFIKEGDKTVQTLRRGSSFSDRHMDAFARSNIQVINVMFNEKLYAYLINLYPDKYRKPYTSLTFFEMDKYLYGLQKINMKSQRKRYLISCEEVTLRSIDGKLDTVIEFGQLLTYEDWNLVKTKLNKHKSFNIRFSENGIICFVDLRPGGEDFIKRFYRNSDLITLLVGRKTTDKNVVAPDFIGNEDVISVDDPEKLLETYKETNAKLIILGDTLDDNYRNALLEVKQWDKFARFLMMTNIDLKKKEDFILTVAKAYDANSWDWDEL